MSKNDLNLEIFQINDNIKDPKKGMVLISEPFSPDSYFKKSVVFLTDHGEDGSFGFILNKPVDIKMSELLTDFPETDCTIAIGGPVNTDRIYFIHSLGEKFLPGSTAIIDNVYWGGEFEKLKELISMGLVAKNQVRFFLGYSGWSPGQLGNELKNKFWLVGNTTGADVMNTEIDIWTTSLKSFGNKYKSWTNIPENPTLN